MCFSITAVGGVVWFGATVRGSSSVDLVLDGGIRWLHYAGLGCGRRGMISKDE